MASFGLNQANGEPVDPVENEEEQVLGNEAEADLVGGPNHPEGERLIVQRWRRPADKTFAKQALQMKAFFGFGYAITDLVALNTTCNLLFEFEQFAVGMNIRVLFISLPLIFETIELMKETLSPWEPLRHEVTETQLKICRRLNFRECFSKLFDYIKSTSRTLITLINNTIIGSKRTEFIAMFRSILRQVNNKSRVVENILRPPLDRPLILHPSHWAPFFNYRALGHLPSRSPAMTTCIDDPTVALPPWILPVKSNIMVKMCLTIGQLVFFAGEGFCGICFELVPNGQTVCILPFCDHFFCHACLMVKFSRTKPLNERFCPSCPEEEQQVITEYGVIPGDPEQNRFIRVLFIRHRVSIDVYLAPKPTNGAQF